MRAHRAKTGLLYTISIAKSLYVSWNALYRQTALTYSRRSPSPSVQRTEQTFQEN